MLERMWKTAKSYLRSYVISAICAAKVDMSFKASFVLMIVMDIFLYFVSFLGMHFVMNQAPLPGMNHDQVLFFLAYMLMINQLHMVFFGDGFWFLSRDLKTGGMDYHLLRPRFILFTLFARSFRFPNSFLLPVAFAILVYYANKANILADFPLLLRYGMMTFYLFLSFVFYICLELILASGMIITKEGLGINFLRLQMQSVQRYPPSIFPKVMRVILCSLVPIFVPAALPFHVFISGTQVLEVSLLFLMATCLIVWITGTIWKKMLLFYESASS